MCRSVWHIQGLEVICLLFPDRTPENKNVEGLSKRKLSGPNPGQSDKKYKRGPNQS